MKKGLLLIFFGMLLTSCNPIKTINSWFNKVDYELEKQNDSQRYNKKKQVEDTARAMISSYESDILTYLTMLKENKQIALQAKIRANNTAVQYNEYILKNNYLWKENIPEDIKTKLEIIQEE